MPLFVMCLLVFAAGIALMLAARLLRSYPVIFLGLIFIIASSVLAIMDEKIMLGICWLLFSALTVIFSGIYLYKNMRGAFWWGLGGMLAMIASAIPYGEDSLLAIIIPVLVFFVIGLIGSLLFPRLFHKRKDERKHLTNYDTLVGKRVEITQEAQAGRSQRGLVGDVDWAIEPLYSYEKFKVGDVVVVKEIKGVTLYCVRDGKDARNEVKKEREEKDAEYAAKAEERRKAREEKAAARKEAKEQERAKRLAEKEAQEKAKAEREAQLKKEKEEEAARKEAAKEEKAQEPEEVVEEPAKEVAPEPVAKEEKPSQVKEFIREGLTHKYSLLYIILSCAIVLLCILVIILAIALKSKIIWLFYVFFVLVLAYAVTIFILEVLKGKNKEEVVEETEEVSEPEPVKEPAPAEEPTPVEEPAPVEEPEPEQAPAKEKPEFVPFQARLAQADDFMRNAYNELKSEALSYGIKSRVSSTGDTFRLHKKEYLKMVVAGKYLKLFLALNPEDYKDTTYPFEDASKLGTRKNTPFVFKIKSGLSIRRAKVLIGDAVKKDGLEQKEVVPHDHFSDLKVMLADDGEEGEEEAE